MMWHWNKLPTITSRPGSEVANVFVEKMAEKGKYAELTCNLADNNCVTRSKSFHQVIDQYPDMVSVAKQDAKGTLIDGKRIMDSILQAHPDVKRRHLWQRAGSPWRDCGAESGQP